MSFKEFDLSDYIHALEDFKATQAETVAKHWGNIENFDLFIQKIRDGEENVAKLAIQQFGSIEKYTAAMKNNLEHFSEIMENQLPEKARKIGQQADSLYEKLTSDFTKDAGSPEVQSIVRSLLLLFQENSSAASFDKPYIPVLIQAYSSDYVRKITDAKYGKEACDYIVRAFRYYEKTHEMRE